MPVDGGPARQLTSHPAEDLAMTWSPSGREIAFMSKRSGNRDPAVSHASSRRTRPMTTSPPGRPTANGSRSRDRVGCFEYPRRAARESFSRWRPGRAGELASLPTEDSFSTKGAGERSSDIFALSLEDAREYPVTHLANRRGSMEGNLATDGGYLYFIWAENFGDLWVMDIVTDGEE